DSSNRHQIHVKGQPLGVGLLLFRVPPYAYWHSLNSDRFARLQRHGPLPALFPGIDEPLVKRIGSNRQPAIAPFDQVDGPTQAGPTQLTCFDIGMLKMK